MAAVSQVAAAALQHCRETAPLVSELKTKALELRSQLAPLTEVRRARGGSAMIYLLHSLCAR